MESLKQTTPIDVYVDKTRKPGTLGGLGLISMGFVYYLFVSECCGKDYMFGGYIVLMAPTIAGLFLDSNSYFEASVFLTMLGSFMWLYTDEETVGITMMAINFIMLLPVFYDNVMTEHSELEPIQPCKEALHEIHSESDPVLTSNKATPEDLQTELLRLRSNFQKYTHLRSYECRLAMINLLEKGFKEMKQEFIDAVRKDLGGDEDAAYMTQFMGMIASFSVVQRGLKSWMKKEPRDTPVNLAPAKSYMLYQPLGVIAIMGCWNFPMNLIIQPMIEAIAAGNCVMLKLSEVAPATEKVLMKYFAKYAHPHYVSVVVGDYNVAIPFSKLKFDKVMFTGGWNVGKHICKAAAENMIPCIIESGGKNPVIIDKSGDLETAAIKLATMGFMNTGQLCLRPDALYVEESIKNKFTERLKHHIQKQWGADKETILKGNYGCMLNEAGAGRVEKMLTEDHGGKVLVGGETSVNDRYIAPTVIIEPKKGSLMQKEEIFGPIMQVYGYKELDEVFEMAYEKRNDLEKPLATYMFCDDKTKHRLLENMTAGSMCMNDCVWQTLNKEMPFGGVGKSGMGSYGGKNGFIAFSHPCSILEKPKSDTSELAVPPLKQWMWLINFMTKNSYWVLVPQWAVLKRLGLVLLAVVLFVSWCFFV